MYRIHITNDENQEVVLDELTSGYAVLVEVDGQFKLKAEGVMQKPNIASLAMGVLGKKLFN